MSTLPHWQKWNDLDELARKRAIFAPGFWEGLNEAQRGEFIDNADWQELRHVPEARTLKLEQLKTMDEICEHMGLTHVKVYWLMSTRKLRGWLVEGEWKFDKTEVDRWVEGMGGLEAVQKDVDEQIEEHRRAGAELSKVKRPGNDDDRESAEA